MGRLDECVRTTGAVLGFAGDVDFARCRVRPAEKADLTCPCILRKRDVGKHSSARRTHITLTSVRKAGVVLRAVMKRMVGVTTQVNGRVFYPLAEEE